MKPIISTLLTAVLLTVIAIPATASGPASDNAGAAERRVFIDPETGERRQPNAEERSAMREGAEAARRTGDDGEPRMIERPDGTRMMIHDRADWPQRRRTEQPDARAAD